MKHVSSIRSKLLVGTVGIAISITLLVLIAAERSAEKAILERIDHDFSRARPAIERVYQSRSLALTEALSTALGDQIFRSQVGRTRMTDSDLGLGTSTADPTAEANRIFQSTDLPIFHQFPVMAVVNSDGTLLFSRAHSRVFGAAIGSQPLLSSALQGLVRTDWLGVEPGSSDSVLSAMLLPDSLNSNSPDLFIGAAAPIRVGSQILGAVLVAESVQTELLPAIRDAAQAAVLLEWRGIRVSAAGLPIAHSQSRLPVGGVGRIQTETGDWFGLTVALGSQPGTTAVLFRSVDAELRPFQARIRRGGTLVGLGGIGLAIAIAFAFSHRLTRPLRALGSGVSRLRAGDLSSRVSISSFDEVGQLTEAFNEMADAVQRKIELEKESVRIQEVSEAKSRFFANINHELRTPLTLILGPIEARLTDRAMNPEEKNFFQAIAANARRLLRQVNMILDLAKVDAGKLSLQTEKANLSELVTDFTRSVSPQAAAKGILIDGSGVQPLPLAWLDVEKVETILSNLVSNALKFTPSGGAIRLSAWAAGDTYFFSVEDNGPGIPAETQIKLFERFVRDESADRQRVSGTGLGLAYSRDLARLHGGDIAVHSETSGEKKGTRFTVSLRVEAAEGEASQGRPASTPRLLEGEDMPLNVQAQLDLHNETICRARSPERPVILFVDDHAGLRDFVVSELRTEFEVLLAEDGVRGLEVLKRCSPDLVLTDSMMPRMTGPELCAAIKHDPVLRMTPVVLLTAKASIESKVDALEGGADDYLTKPFSRYELRARVSNLIRMRRAQVQTQNDLRLARDIQTALLPAASPVYQRIQFDTLYLPCAQLSGDFLDIVPGASQWTYFYLVDVTSHGTASAQVTYLLKEICRQVIQDSASDLAESYRQIASRYRSYQLEYDVSVVLGRVDGITGKLELLRAGAPSAVQFHPQEGFGVIAVEPSPTLQAVGQRGEGTRAINVVSLDLTAGQSVYCFSDGVYEFQSGGKAFERRRWYALLQEWEEQHGRREGRPDGECARQILSELRKQVDSPGFGDDLSMIRLQFLNRQKNSMPSGTDDAIVGP